MTIGEQYGPALGAADQAEADREFERLVARRVAGGMRREEAVALERISIGYLAGYLSRVAFEHVLRLYGTEHPVFRNAWPTSPAEALAMAQSYYERTRPDRAD